MDQQMGNFMSHAIVFLSGATALGIIGHAVNTFPTPANKYGAWFIGVIQYVVGQRQQALNTMNGQATITASVSRSLAEELKTGTGAGSAREL